MMNCRCIANTHGFSVGQTAGDLMTRDPIAIDQDATIRDAACRLAEAGVRSSPVVNGKGRPVGVLSRSDIERHYGEDAAFLLEDRQGRLPSFLMNRRDDIGGAAVADRTTVREIMTPAVVRVSPETPVEQVVRVMAGLMIHRLFVVDAAGVLVGAISTLDVLRALSRPPDRTAGTG